jgi:hypothetical protein
VAAISTVMPIKATMPIAADTGRAKGIAAKRARIAELLQQDQFQSDRGIADVAGTGHSLVAKVRRELVGRDGLIRPVEQNGNGDLELSPGRYRLNATPKNATGHVGQTKQTLFRIIS